MGAVPERIGPHEAAAPLRETVNQTESTEAISGAKPGPRRFARVPTHTVGVADDRRRYPRASLSLPLRLIRVGATPEPAPVTLVTRDISSSGIYFLAPRDIAPGTAIELEVALVDRPLGYGRVQMLTAAHVVRCEESDMPGWKGYAASFDDFALQRDDVLPMRFRA
jgi:hypothetical protein